MRTHTIFIVLIFYATAIYSQIPRQVDTVDYYIYHTLSYLGDSCIIDNDKTYPKEVCQRIHVADSIYDNINYDNRTIRFFRYRQPDGGISFTAYESDPEKGPFGEYVKYYPTGQIEYKWYFQEPNDSLNNPGVMEGFWVYFNINGDTIGTKQYKNGLADGKWTLIVDSGFVIKQFKNGFSEGTWSYIKHDAHGGSLTHPNYFHNGFNHSIYPEPCDCFETKFDLKREYIWDEYSIIEIEKIEYIDENHRQVKNGKFYVVRDGIITELKEFKDGELMKRTKFDYR